MKAKLLGACSLLLIGLAAAGCVGVTRLEPGYAAVLIDYTNGSRTDIPAGGNVSYNPITQRVAQYPVGQQSLVMVRNEQEGQIKGDDSVDVRIKAIAVHMDTTLFWRIDPKHVADIFQLRPDVPLVGKDVNSGIDGIVVRRLTRGAMQDAGALFDSYLDVYTTKRQQFTDTVAKSLGCPTTDPNDPLNTIPALQRQADPNTELGKDFIICDRLQLGDFYLDPEQQKAVSDQQNSLTQVQTSANQALSAKNDADAKAAPIVANAAAEATAIALREKSLADSPHVIQYDVAVAQANHPALVQGSGSQVQIPLSALQTPEPAPQPAVQPAGSPTPPAR